MIISFAICMGLVGHMTMAVPLEYSSLDLASPAALAVESPSSDLSQYFESRIVGGSEAPLGTTPYIIAIVFGTQYKSFTCGGSVVTKKYGISAAHCIHVDWHGNMLESLHGIVGTNTWNSGGRVIEFEGHQNHPDYNPVDIKFDITVITFKKAVQFDDYVQPIRLDYRPVGGGVQTRVTGWGTLAVWGITPDKLQVLYPTTLSAEDCEKLIASIAHLWWLIPPRDHKSEICTFISEGQGVCHGDSGSPLTLNGFQIGMVVWGFPCGAGGPDVYGWLGAYRDFLEKNIYGKC